MAEVVNVAVGDTITSIAASRKGSQDLETRAWVEKILKLNPHIGNPDRIYPDEKLLIPDTVNEHVSEAEIWNNALRRMPPQLSSHPPMLYEIPVKVIQPGDTIEKLACEAFEETHYRNVPESVKRAVFLHNNPRLYFCQFGRALPGGTLANMTPFMLPRYDVADWESQNPVFQVQFN